MPTRTTILALAATALLTWGCADHRAEQPAPAAQTAQRKSVVETTAVVEKVDQATREVQLRATNGELVSVVAGPEVRNLPQLAAGDVVRLTYYESVAVSMAEAGNVGPTTATAVVGRAPEGQKPAGVVGATVNTVVTIVSYDPATAVATVTTAEGATERVVVHPAMRAFAAARKPGDRVAVELTTAVAVSIVETGA